MTLPSLSHKLPYWTWRNVPVGSTEVAVLVLIDGTLVVGYESSGADVFAADNAALNRHSGSIRRALNVLTADGFLQVEWHTGESYSDVIAAYEQRGVRARGSVLAEQRRARAALLRGDESLRRGRLVVFVGQRRALGTLQPHAARGLSRLLSSGRDPQTIEPAAFIEAVERLSEIAARVRDELSACGSVLTPLANDALLEEAHRALNPITSKSVPVLAVDRPLELDAAATADPAFLVHRPLSVREQLPLGDLVWNEESFTLDDPPVLSRALSLQRLPAFTKPDFMMGLQFATQAHVRLVSTFVATDRQKLTERLIRKRNIAHAQAVGIVRDVAADVAFSEYERVLERMLTEDQRVFEASVGVVVHATSHEALDRGTRELKDAFSDAGAVLSTETGRQMPAFLGTLPGYGFSAPRKHQLITNNAADLVPYFVPSLGDEDAQLVYHTRQSTLRKLSLTPNKRRANCNGLIFGGTGSGKSFNFACALEQACLAEGSPLLIVDVQGPELSSYKLLCEVFGGSYTALATDDEASFSPFLSHDELMVEKSTNGTLKRGFDDEALRFMAALVCVMALPDLPTRRERPFALDIARAAIARAYRATRAEARTPILSDVLAELERFEPEHEEHKAIAREMYLQLETWVKDPLRARLLNRPAQPRTKKTMQVFDFFGMEKDKELATVLLLSVSFAIWQHLKSYPRDVQKLVVFDECWKLLTHETASEIVAELFRTGRKWGASTWAITQNLADFKASPIHAAVLNNAAMIFLMQHAGDHSAVSEVCGLNDREDALFRQLKMKKGEFSEMLFVERGTKEASILRLVPTGFDLWLNTTDPTDVGMRSRILKERGLSLLEAIRFCAEHYPLGAPRRAVTVEGASP